MNTSPTKRRALGPVDANCRSPATNGASTLGPTKALLTRDANCGSNENDNKNKNIGDSVHIPSNKHKRAVAETGPPECKRRRTTSLSLGLDAPGEGLLVHDDREPSASPEPSLVFDSSTIDTSQATCHTELDVEAPIHSPPRPTRRSNMTREEARQKAEVLRLRLGLAGYKVRTGQQDVPLEHLQVRRVPHHKQSRQPLRRETNVGGQAAMMSRVSEPTRTWPSSHVASPKHASPEKGLLSELPETCSDTHAHRYSVGEKSASQA